MTLGQLVCRSALLWGLLTAEDPWMHIPDPTLAQADAVLVLLALAVAMPTLAVWMVWIGLSYARITGLEGASWGSTPVWAALSWMIPIGNLVLPRGPLEDVWCNAVPADQRPLPQVPALVRGFWGAWVAAWLVTGGSLWMTESSPAMVLPNAALDVLAPLARAACLASAAAVAGSLGLRLLRTRRG